ncbi:ribbon-helix-helix domain-containing protein [Archaeoglobus neptunius]|uniref:ribbon-helix-helix domain-containing protein n=1 Tax=Archaeoglobus neptunius TaxID=2798580 RepID=UPI001925F12E|nr:type II toxin-antitoxin system ParD family antitoxin [Archaeoglobus neptunius]
MPPTRKISIRLTEKYYTKLELLVESGEFTSVSEAIREAVKLLLEKYSAQLESIAKMDSFR